MSTKPDKTPTIEEVLNSTVKAINEDNKEAAIAGFVTLATSFFISLNRIAAACERQAVAAEKSFAVMDRMSPVEVHHADEMTEQERLNAILDKKKG